MAEGKAKTKEISSGSGFGEVTVRRAHLLLKRSRRYATKLDERGRLRTDAIVVPRGEWHTARVLEPTEAIFVTRGAGTEHRPL